MYKSHTNLSVLKGHLVFVDRRPLIWQEIFDCYSIGSENGAGPRISVYHSTHNSSLEVRPCLVT